MAIDKNNPSTIPSMNEMEDTVKPLIETFQSDVKGTKETTLKLRELSRLSR